MSNPTKESLEIAFDIGTKFNLNHEEMTVLEDALNSYGQKQFERARDLMLAKADKLTPSWHRNYLMKEVKALTYELPEDKR